MGRGENERIYKIRYKEGGRFVDIFIPANNDSQAVARAKPKGRVLFVRKVSNEDVFKTDEKFLKRILMPDPRTFSLDKLFSRINSENNKGGESDK